MMNIKMNGFKKLINSKLLYTLPLASIGLIGTKQTANAMFNPPRNTPTVKHFNGASSTSTSRGSLSTTTTTTTTPKLTTGVSPYRPSGARVSKLVSMFEPSSTTQPSSLETKQAPTPDYNSLGARPKTSSTDTKTKSTYKSTLTINLGSKTSTSSITSTTQPESKTSTTPSTSTSTEPKTTHTPQTDKDNLWTDYKQEMQNLRQSQEKLNNEFKANLEKTKLDIRESLEKNSLSIAKESSSTQKKILKHEIQNRMQNQLEIAKKINSSFEEMKQDIRKSLEKSSIAIAKEALSEQNATFKKELENTIQNQSAIAEKINSSFEEIKQDIRKSLEKSSIAIAKEALSNQNTTFKKELENIKQNQSKISEKISSDWEKTKQAILDTGMVQGALNVQQAMTDTIQSTIKGKSENNK